MVIVLVTNLSFPSCKMQLVLRSRYFRIQPGFILYSQYGLSNKIIFKIHNNLCHKYPYHPNLRLCSSNSKSLLFLRNIYCFIQTKQQVAKYNFKSSKPYFPLLFASFNTLFLIRDFFPMANKFRYIFLLLLE